MKNGFTLIEVMVAILILLIGILGFYGLWSRVAKYRYYTNKLGEAIFLAKSKIEEFNVINYNALEDGGASEDSFRIEWKINEIVSGELKKVSIKVGWDGDNCSNNIDNCLHNIMFVSTVFRKE